MSCFIVLASWEFGGFDTEQSLDFLSFAFDLTDSLGGNITDTW